jgi:hypothetical protein
VSQSTVWFHDSRGDRQITSEGYGLLPSVSPDARKLYYLLRAGGAQHYVSPDGKWVVIPDSTDVMAWPAMLYPIGGGSPTPLCAPCDGSNDVERISSPAVSWSPDGKFLYLKFQEFSGFQRRDTRRLSPSRNA